MKIIVASLTLALSSLLAASTRAEPPAPIDRGALLSGEERGLPLLISLDRLPIEWPCRIPRLCREVCVNFEIPPAGTQWGPSAGNAPGSVVYSENGISVGVDTFVQPWFTAFGWAEVETQPVTPGIFIGSGQIVRLNNIDLTFDFSALPFTPASVRFEFLDLGGYENIAVDHHWILQGELLPAPPGVGVSFTPLPSGKKGIVEIPGPVTRLGVGGQELWIDRVCAVPPGLPFHFPIETQ